ncbi:hypothetical protein ACU4GG_01250 [Streptomyces nojiriensis]
MRSYDRARARSISSWSWGALTTGRAKFQKTRAPSRASPVPKNRGPAFAPDSRASRVSTI